MLNQSFNYDNLFEAYTYLNRKGFITKDLLPPNYLSKAKKYSEILDEIKQHKKDDQVNTDDLYAKLHTHSEEMNGILSEELRYIEKKINDGKFKFTLVSKIGEDPSKPTYSIPKDLTNYLAMNVLCRNLKKTFVLQMTDRNRMLIHLKQILSEDRHQKIIIKTDIKHCFESIPHDKLFKILDSNTLLNHQNKSIIKVLIDIEFEKANLRKIVQTEHIGLPRGCAISSYLAELYLSKIDDEILKSYNNICYYNRYVDDIIIILYKEINPSKKKDSNEYKEEIVSLFKRFDLTISEDKTEYIDTSCPNFTFELLGYKFTSTKNGLILKLSDNKTRKIKDRIDKVFENFTRDVNIEYFKAKQDLFCSLKYLANNTTLSYKKKHIKIGIYYSNRLLDDTSVLNEFDTYLKQKIDSIKLTSNTKLDRSLNIAKEEARLKQTLIRNISFMQGFVSRKQFCFSPKLLRKIKKSWK